ncbi:nitrate reductase molybdenum cofactor assembly chaperone [Gordonia sp. ABSL1-1]|uniref:nitrate reductase molybdenum cofactor assembly chaperone n=1 Tax=Gordonia sp. ABSL1-1 TaxID=3053923 RepID=UPI0025726A8F|nr:nitrate reductase molybdenum cofactor assembly chaperone [Gordonia sp. ABSL1-1]MDL9936675.1 nitrate reductase molybdenum cofactor assembly chaperone [Gordonia sp. ABSL1-1]
MRSGFGRKTGTRNDFRVTSMAASWCLSYPADEVLARLPLIRDALAEQSGHRAAQLLAPVVDGLLGTDPERLRHEYVDVFDLSRKHTLYLTYWSDGDTRRRGAALGEFKTLYRDSGFLVDLHGELPDHLPIVLEYCAAVPDQGRALLEKHRPALELIRLSLLERGSRYAGVLAAVCAMLPGESPADAASAMAMRTTIPTEAVGLEPFDPRLLPLHPTGERR